MRKDKLTVIDFFCGAGGFSEGFRQQDFEILLGIDHWQPAIDTFNLNFNKDFCTKNILDYSLSIYEIENLPDSDVIIGSPPCVSFSSSNKSGKADKSLGVQLIECFLKIIVVKKYKSNSQLKAWFMENVVNSKKHLQPSYTFHDLKLYDWALSNNKDPFSIAINLSDNSRIINSINYGSIQSRNRLISGEIIKFKKFILPEPIKNRPAKEKSIASSKTIRLLKECFPSPFGKSSNELIKDPLYDLSIEKNRITDHFYDTGIYASDWRDSKYLKLNHPYMGKMAFPENIDAPSRTIMATKIGASREAIIYPCEIIRKGNGEFRTPTIREAAIIMGFPISYQFIGSENTKWRLVGNAVCPCISRSLAITVRNALSLSRVASPQISSEVRLKDKFNLNTFSIKKFDKQPLKNKGSRFRRHPFKNGNMTIALSNYDIEKNEKEIDKWRVTVFYGTGEGFAIKSYNEHYYKKLEPIISKSFPDGKKFLDIINNGFSNKIAGKKLLQEMYENRRSADGFFEPTRLIDEVAKLITKFSKDDELFVQNGKEIFQKQIVPKKQLYALYILNKIISIANNK